MSGRREPGRCVPRRSTRWPRAGRPTSRCWPIRTRGCATRPRSRSPSSSRWPRALRRRCGRPWPRRPTGGRGPARCWRSATCRAMPGVRVTRRRSRRTYPSLPAPADRGRDRPRPDAHRRAATGRRGRAGRGSANRVPGHRVLAVERRRRPGVRIDDPRGLHDHGGASGRPRGRPGRPRPRPGVRRGPVGVLGALQRRDARAGSAVAARGDRRPAPRRAGPPRARPPPRS